MLRFECLNCGNEKLQALPELELRPSQQTLPTWQSEDTQGAALEFKVRCSRCGAVSTVTLPAELTIGLE